MGNPSKNELSVSLDRALFEGQIQGLVAVFYENERPPQGLTGLLDWYFQGAISKCLKKGIIQGSEGECTYFPLTKNNTTYHLILAGAGQTPAPGKRNPVPTSTLKNLHKNLISLKLSKIGISCADFGNVDTDYFSKQIKGVPLWIAN